jgi:hypothetical protein
MEKALAERRSAGDGRQGSIKPEGLVRTNIPA